MFEGYVVRFGVGRIKKKCDEVVVKVEKGGNKIVRMVFEGLLKRY